MRRDRATRVAAVRLYRGTSEGVARMAAELVRWRPRASGGLRSGMASSWFSIASEKVWELRELVVRVEVRGVGWDTSPGDVRTEFLPG